MYRHPLGLFSVELSIIHLYGAPHLLQKEEHNVARQKSCKRY